MTIVQFRVFYVTSVLASILLIGQIVLGQIVRGKGEEINALEQELRRGQQAFDTFQQIAGRTYQLSQTDSGLRDVVIRQQISVKPSTVSAPTPSDGGPGTETIDTGKGK